MITLVKNFELINDRICYLQISGKIWVIILINYNAPTESADNDTKNDFYDSLERVFDNHPRKCI